VSTVLFACVHNAGRSQMAAALFNALADPTRATALSAGTQPAAAVHPEVMVVMREAGIDLAAAVPTRLTDDLIRTRNVGVLVTMGCGETCPVVPGVRRIEWTIADPKGRDLEHVRAIRDEIRDLVIRLLTTEGWSRSAASGPRS
jgi:arsenate reductase